MKAKTKSVPKSTRRTKNTSRESSPTASPEGRTVPRCSRCGSRTVRLEQLNQELLAVLAVHCLICGHHAFIGKPMVRLIRRPNIPQNVNTPSEVVKT